MKKTNNIKKVNIKASPVHYITGVVFIALIVIIICFVLKPTDKRILLKNGTIEKTEIVTAYVIKKESVIDKDIAKVMVPVVGEGSKTQKGGIIATYKSDEYKNYEETLSKMDKEILELMNDLPVIYSSEVDAIDREIYEIVKQSIGETSYAKMQEYKQRINTYINKRANIISDLSPDGAEIRKLITKRNEYESSAKKSNDNVIATMSGLVSYKTDGLEEKLFIDNINELGYSDIKEIVEKNNEIDNTTIKIVNNYEAYIVTKVPLESKEYLKESYDYNIRLLENNNQEIKGELTKICETEDGIELYFKITNGIEYLVDLREIEIEIIWWGTSGLIIENTALNKYENKEIYYVYAVKYSEIVRVPVKVSKQNDNYSVITNYTNEELKEMDLESIYKIKLHDRIIIKNEK